MRSLSRQPDLAEQIIRSRGELDSVIHDWLACGRDDQLPPVVTPKGEPWHTWLVLGGRGSGKTRAGAEWVRAQALHLADLADRRSHRIALVGDTIGQVRSVMIEGLSGLMSIHLPAERPTLEASRNQLVWPNGTIAQMFAADNPDSLRGPQFDAAWCDELCKWRRPDVAWDTLQFALRLGELPQVVVTTTPRPIPLLKRIMDDHATAVTLVDMSQDEIGLDYIWRCGPANRDIGHTSYLETTHAFAGVGLRPLSPAHVRGSRAAGDLAISWVRRTRTGGDSWDAAEVPLGEETERYEVDILDGATVKRTLAATTPAATYTAAQQTVDFGAPQSSVSCRVFQLSAVHGRGIPRPATL